MKRHRYEVQSPQSSRSLTGHADPGEAANSIGEFVTGVDPIMQPLNNEYLPSGSSAANNQDQPVNGTEQRHPSSAVHCGTRVQ